jgi:glucan phosphoethanolaminetransferase (alkaline phosphatase superfamily)
MWFPYNPYNPNKYIMWYLSITSYFIGLFVIPIYYVIRFKLNSKKQKVVLICGILCVATIMGLFVFISGFTHFFKFEEVPVDY